MILKDAGSNIIDVGKRFRHQDWTPAPQWLKKIINASKNSTNKMTASFMFAET